MIKLNRSKRLLYLHDDVFNFLFKFCYKNFDLEIKNQRPENNLIKNNDIPLQS